jgi:hypothetical protein
MNIDDIFKSKLRVWANFYIGKHYNKKDDTKNNGDDEKPFTLRRKFNPSIVHVSIFLVEVPLFLLCTSHY